MTAPERAVLPALRLDDGLGRGGYWNTGNEDNDMEWLEERDFYELMQTYRHASPLDQAAVIAAFEAVKQIIRDKCKEREEWPDSRRDD